MLAVNDKMGIIGRKSFAFITVLIKIMHQGTNSEPMFDHQPVLRWSGGQTIFRLGLLIFAHIFLLRFN